MRLSTEQEPITESRSSEVEWSSLCVLSNGRLLRRGGQELRLRVTSECSSLAPASWFWRLWCIPADVLPHLCTVLDMEASVCSNALIRMQIHSPHPHIPPFVEFLYGPAHLSTIRCVNGAHRHVVPAHNPLSCYFAFQRLLELIGQVWIQEDNRSDRRSYILTQQQEVRLLNSPF